MSFATAQQTFVLIKTSWRRLEDVFRLRLQKTSSRRLHQDEYICLTRTSSEMSSRCLQEVLIRTNILVLVIHLQDVFKTFSRRSQDDLKTSCQDVFKRFWRRLQDIFKTSSKPLQEVFKTFWRRLQDVFKTSSRHLQDFFKTSSRRLAKTSSRRFQGVSPS